MAGEVRREPLRLFALELVCGRYPWVHMFVTVLRLLLLNAIDVSGFLGLSTKKVLTSIAAFS